MGKPSFAWVCCVPLPPSVLRLGGRAPAGTWREPRPHVGLHWLPPVLGDPGPPGKNNDSWSCGEEGIRVLVTP